jgi:hypothetical protein
MTNFRRGVGGAAHVRIGAISTVAAAQTWLDDDALRDP